jgi:hypothetical protein
MFKLQTSSLRFSRPMKRSGYAGTDNGTGLALSSRHGPQLFH